MTWIQADFVTAFDTEAADVAALATTAQKTQWFNEGQGRLMRWRPMTADKTWAAADRTIALPSDFVQLDKLVLDTGSVYEDPWRVFGANLVLENSDGAMAAGSARLYYWAAWPALSGSQASLLTQSLDYACMYYALSRFYKRLSSNRAYYKRYATLVGQNAVSMTDLQQESDRYYQDYLDARDDEAPTPPAFAYNSN